MRTEEIRFQNRIRFSLQIAMLGNVVPNLRGITFGFDDRKINIIAYFDGPVCEEDAETMSCIETEVISDFYPDAEVELNVVRCDAPQKLEMLKMWVYGRKE